MKTTMEEGRVDVSRNTASNPGAAGNGLDAAVRCREDDHMGRWSFAKEVYGVATTGPQQWSVRIGVYGEWGTGKTSVLNFVATMARQEGHIVVRFNPWEYSNKQDLWHGFVQAIVAELPAEAVVSWMARRGWWKRLGVKVAPFIVRHGERISDAIDDRRVTLGIFGISLLKDFVFATHKDLETVLTGRGDKRLVVLIDDLDRTSGDLVPEILFAIKEIMDVGGCAFVCAFDPKVVGEVLGAYHPGFGDGLEFLEKIIEYPRCLPEPTREALLCLAERDIRQNCPYVPMQAVKETIDLLPPNPRMLRQFIRLLSLLRPQIERHYEYELMWPVILGANVLKVRYPLLASALLADEDFWQRVIAADMFKDKNADEKQKLLDTHVEQVLKTAGHECNGDEKGRITTVLDRLASRASIWTGGSKSVVYQMHVAEAPAAVTWREYDQFVEAWTVEPTRETAETWIRGHAIAVGRDDRDVYRELLDATIRGRHGALSHAAEELTEVAMALHLGRADVLMSALECLTFTLGRLETEDKPIGQPEFEQLFKAMTDYFGWTSSARYRDFRRREQAFLVKLVNDWSHDVMPVIKALKPFSDPFMLDFEGKDLKAFHAQLSNVIVPRYAKQVLGRFREPGFVRQVYSAGDESYEARCILLDVKGPLWSYLRKDVLTVLADATLDMAVHQNAYELLHWFDHMLQKEPTFDDTQRATALFLEPDIRSAIWNAATAHALNPRAVGSLKDLPVRLAAMNAPVKVPDWWTRALEGMGVAKQ